MKVLPRAVLAEERRYLCRVYFNPVPIIGVAFITTLLLASRVIWPPPAVVPRFLVNRKLAELGIYLYPVLSLKQLSARR